MHIYMIRNTCDKYTSVKDVLRDKFIYKKLYCNREFVHVIFGENLIVSCGSALGTAHVCIGHVEFNVYTCYLGWNRDFWKYVYIYV